MKRLGFITLQFYRLLLIYNVSFTMLAMFLMAFDSWNIDNGIFISAKVIGFMAAVGLQYFSAKETYFYFRNAGYRVTRIIINAFAIDLFICALIVILSKFLSYAAAHIKG